MNRVSIIGAGRVGATFAALTARTSRYCLNAVVSRSEASAARAVAMAGAGSPLTTLAGAGPADLWIVSTPDDEIEAAARDLAASRLLRPTDVVLHCSGARPAAELLRPCEETGVHVGSVHPIMSFADPAVARDRFAGTVCAFEGSIEAEQAARAWIHELGGRLLTISPSQKLRYHAGHVFASNYLVSLLEVALRQFEAAGIDRATAIEFLGPLISNTVENVRTLGLERALTGPIARGDSRLVREEVEALAGTDRKLYCLLGEVACAVAERSGGISKEDAATVLTALRD